MSFEEKAQESADRAALSIVGSVTGSLTPIKRRMHPNFNVFSGMMDKP